MAAFNALLNIVVHLVNQCSIISKHIASESYDVSAMFPRALWDMHTRVQNILPQTNNNLVGWHNRFSSMFTHSHLSIGVFINTLNRVSPHNHLTMSQILAGAERHRRVYREISTRLQMLVQGYNINDVVGLLRGLSYNSALK